MPENSKEIQEKSIIIKDFLVDGYSLRKIDIFMKSRKQYKVENCFDFMRDHLEYFKDIGFIRRKK